MIWTNTKYMGIPIMKCPLDLWVTQEIMVEVKPDIFIETGTWRGASALFYAHVMDNVGNGRVITIDNEKRENLPEHPRIEYITGDCLSPEVIDQLKPNGTVMVNLDSEHSEDHVLKEMEIYALFVSEGSYMIVEDGINGHPSKLKKADGSFIFPGPYEAIEKFLKIHPEFECDRTRERHIMTFNVKGFLKRTAYA